MKSANLKKMVNNQAEEVKLKLKDVASSYESLKLLSEHSMPAFTGFKLSLFLKSVSPIIETFSKERDKLITELGEKEVDKDGKENGRYTFSDKNKEEFNNRITELLEVDVDLRIPDIKISELSSINIEPKHLIALHWLIKE